MIIESIHIASFGCLQDFSCTLGEGLNIIEGSNESGKSTLAAFIRYMLYGFPGRAAGGELSEKKKRISWQDGNAAGSMTVRVGDRRYRIERATAVTGGLREKESYREVGKIIDLADNSIVHSGHDAGQVFFGVPERVFVNTAFIGQVGSPRLEGGMNEAIENILFSGDENLSAQKAMDKLDSLRRTLLYKNEKGGLIFDLKKDEEDLVTRLERAQAQNAEILRDEAELEEIARRLGQAETELAAATARETQAKSIVLVAAFDHLHRAEAERDEAMRELRDMEGMPAYLLHDSDLTDLQVARAAAEAGEAQARRAREEREACEARQAVAEESRRFLEAAEREGGCEACQARYRTAHTRFRGGLVLTAVALLLALAGAASALLVPALLTGSLAYALVAAGVLAAVLLSAGIPLLAAGGRTVRATYRTYEARGHKAMLARLCEIVGTRDALGVHRNDAANALARENDAYAEYNRLLGELDTVVRRFGSRLPHEDVLAFVDNLTADARRVMERKKSYEATRVSSEEAIRMLKMHLGDANEEEARAALPDGPMPRTEDLHLEELNRQTAFYRDQERQLSAQHHELENKIASARARVEDPARLGAELDDVRERLAAARARYEACVLAYDAIAGAGDRLRRDVSPRLGDFTGHMMACLTEGRYASVGVTGELDLAVETGASTRSVDYLSAGTQDLAYLSLRMALIDLLYEEKPPVCFDESFVHQDDGRAAHMVEVLLFLSRAGQQNLVFTCHSRERSLAGEQAGEGEVCYIRLSE